VQQMHTSSLYSNHSWILNRQHKTFLWHQWEVHIQAI
jgi:hypothetical protein